MTSDATLKSAQAVRTRDDDGRHALYKGGIQIAVCLAALLLVLLSGVTYTDGAVNIKLSFLHAFNALFFEGKVGYMLYSELIYISVPSYISLFPVVVLAVYAACIGLFVWFNLIRRRDLRRLGYVQIVAGAAVTLFYLLLLFGSFFSCWDYHGSPRVFYQLYEVSPLVLFGGLLMAFVGLIQLRCPVGLIPKVKKYFVFYLLLIVPTLLILVFAFYPIFLQVILSFKEYTLADGIWGSRWIGLENFARLFTEPAMLMVIWRTVYLSFLRLIAGIVPSVFFALVFFHINKLRFRSVVQTIVYIPHFFSWVVIYAIISAFLTPDGVVNNIIVNVFHGETIDFLSRPDLFYLNMILTSIWKEVGWGTILFMASLMSIDKSLYDAAAIDGAGVWKKLTRITLPGMVPILVFQVIMAVGNILKGAGGEQILIFATGSVKENEALVIDTWLYWQGLQELQYGLSSAMSFVQSVIGFVLVIATHKLSQRTVGIGAW